MDPVEERKRLLAAQLSAKQKQAAGCPAPAADQPAAATPSAATPGSSAPPGQSPAALQALELERIQLERQRLELERAKLALAQAKGAAQAAAAAPVPAPSAPPPRAPERARKSPTRRAKPGGRGGRGGARARRPLPPRRSSNAVPLVLGGLGVGFLVVLAGYFALKPQPAERPADDVVIATPTPEARPTLTPTPRPRATPREPAADPVRQGLARAAELEDARREREAFDVISQLVSEHGKTSDLEAARKQLLGHCREIVQREVEAIGRQLKAGLLDEARTQLSALRQRMPAQVAARITELVSAVDPQDLLQGGEAQVAQAPEDPQPVATPERTMSEGEAEVDEEEEPPPVEPDDPLAPPGPDPARQQDLAWLEDHVRIARWEVAPTYKSKYYLIKTNVKKEYAKRYGQIMDRYFKRFLKVFKAFLPSKRYEKSEIWIYSSQQEFMNQEGAPFGMGGYYLPATKKVVTYHRGGEHPSLSTLSHEGTHQFEDFALRGKIWNAPIWIIEGLAVFFESAYYDAEEDEVVIGLVPRDRLHMLKRGQALGRLIPLKRLISTPQRGFGAYHYAHAWSLIYFVLYYSDDAKVRKRTQRWFSDLFAAALDGPVSTQAVVDSLGGWEQFYEFEAQWQDWIRELPYDFDPREN